MESGKKPAAVRAVMAAVVLLACCMSSAARAADRLYSPYVEQGEFEVEYFASRTVDDDGAKGNEQKQQLSVGYGVTSYWATEVYGKFKKEPQDDLRFDKWEWENIFQLTQQGEYWADVGAAIAYEWTPRDDRADTVEGRIILAKDVARTSHVLNAVAEKDVGSGPKSAMEGKLLWSSRYRYDSAFEPGFEISSDFGELNNSGSFDDQGHYIGPTAYGKVHVGGTGKFKYRLGYLFGVSDAASSGDALAHLEYEIPLN